MENSGKVLFGDETPQWYVAVGERWIGPLTAADVYEKILNHQITWAHYVWKKGQAEWKRICDTKTFQAMGPHEPDKHVVKEVKQDVKPVVRQAASRSPKAPAPPSKPQAESRIWYLYYNDSQYGPFSQDEIKRFLKIGKIHGKVHIWRDGMKNWDRLERVQEFQGGTSELPRSEVNRVKLEQRETPRRPLIAKILMSDDHSVIVGVCRDISIGGLQVLTERIPANVGAKLKMNISPSSNDTGRPIDPFVAEGTIVRILEDGRGFSFRFDDLNDRSRQAIESYIESPV